LGGYQSGYPTLPMSDAHPEAAMRGKVGFLKGDEGFDSLAICWELTAVKLTLQIYAVKGVRCA